MKIAGRCALRQGVHTEKLARFVDMIIQRDASLASVSHILANLRTQVSLHGVLQCGVVCCSVLQCVAVCCSVLQCVTVCCSVLQCVASVSHILANLRTQVSLHDVLQYVECQVICVR